MEINFVFCHHVWWLRRLMWWFADKLAGIRNGFRNLRTVSVIHFREMTGVIREKSRLTFNIFGMR